MDDWGAPIILAGRAILIDAVQMTTHVLRFDAAAEVRNPMPPARRVGRRA